MYQTLSPTPNAVDARRHRLPEVGMIGVRLVMRHYRRTDAEAVCEAIQESRTSLARWVPDIARYQTVDQVSSALSSLESMRSRAERLVFGLWERSSRRFVGEVGLYDVNWESRSAEVGYWLRETARGLGYAAEGLGFVSELAVRGLGMRQLDAHIAIDNLASMRLAERMGFRCVGQRPATPQWDGDVDRVLIFRHTVEPARLAA
jgi:RimJ/RimL family protein N-acetyltransferase